MNTDYILTVLEILFDSIIHHGNGDKFGVLLRYTINLSFYFLLFSFFCFITSFTFSLIHFYFSFIFHLTLVFPLSV